MTVEEGITINHVKAFVLNLIVAGNFPGSFRWDEQVFKRALVAVARESRTLRPFVGRMLMTSSVASDGKRMYEIVKRELITMWLDADDPNDPKSKAHVSDVALRNAHESRDLLTQEQLNELRRVGPEFMKSLAAA